MMCPKMLKNTAQGNAEVKITTDQTHAFSSPHNFDNAGSFPSRRKHIRNERNKAIQEVTSREKGAMWPHTRKRRKPFPEGLHTLASKVKLRGCRFS